MTEGRVFFPSGALTLEGRFFPRPGTRGAVIAHPHPLMGGTMMDGVTMLLAEVFRQKGFSTLRFNFRGVGMSEGRFDEGDGQVDDLQAAAGFLSTQGMGEIWLAGYSFGAIIAARYLSRDPDVRFTLLVSPPVKDLRSCLPGMEGKKGVIVSGDADYFCPVDELKRLSAETAWEAAIVPGADHFYFGNVQGLMQTAGRWIV